MSEESRTERLASFVRVWRRGFSLLLVVILPVLCLGTWTGSACGQDEEAYVLEVGPLLSAELLAELDAAEVEDRAAAAERIFNDATISDETLFFTITNSPTLTPEQHERLLQIAERRRLDRPGVIGIWMETLNPPPKGVGVRNIMVEAPAFEVLLRGDVILSINGHGIGSMDASEDLRFAVAAGRAGDQLVMQILRRGELLVVETKLADPRQLAEFGSSTLDDNRRAQWAAIHHAVGRMPMRVTLVDENGNVIESLANFNLDPTNPANIRDSAGDRRRAWQIESDLISRINRIQDLESTSRRLFEVADSITLRRALTTELLQLRREAAQTAQELTQFKLSLMEGRAGVGSATKENPASRQ